MARKQDDTSTLQFPEHSLPEFGRMFGMEAKRRQIRFL
jgi:hypothetical protein